MWRRIVSMFLMSAVFVANVLPCCEQSGVNAQGEGCVVNDRWRIIRSEARSFDGKNIILRQLLEKQSTRSMVLNIKGYNMGTATVAPSEIVYSGIDNLEVMRLAHNYNAFLINQVRKAARGAQTALDFGAGLGAFAIKVRDAGLQVDTVETDPDLKAELVAHGFEVFSSTAGLDGEKYDFIYSLNVLEHIEDDFDVFLELSRISMVGGSVYIYVPALKILWSSMDDKVKHFRRYTRGELEGKMRRAGFVIERSRYCDAIGFFATLAFKLVGSRGGDLNPIAIKIFDGFLFPLNRILDVICGPFFGKNVYVVARKVRMR